MIAPVNAIILAGRGTAMIAVAIYLAVLGHTRIGFDYVRMIAGLARDPAAIIEPAIGIPLLAWVLFVLIGVLFVGVGASAANGGRDLLLAARAVAAIAIGAATVWWSRNVTDTPILRLFLEFVAVWLVASAATRLVLGLRGMRPERLPDPRTNPDLPMSEPASRDEARDGMSGRGQWRPPEFSE